MGRCFLQVVHYKPGTFYKAHWDACDPKQDPRCVEDYKKGGLRFATFIIYLNDDMEGGETEFPLMNRKISIDKNIINICSNNPINIIKIVRYIEKYSIS